MKAVLIADWYIPDVGRSLKHHCREQYPWLHFVLADDFEETEALLQCMPFDAVISQPALVAEKSKRLQSAVLGCEPVPGVLLWGGFMPFQHPVALQISPKTNVSLVEVPCTLELLTERLLKLLDSHEHSVSCYQYVLRSKGDMVDIILELKRSKQIQGMTGTHLKVINAGQDNGMVHDVRKMLRGWGMTVTSTTSGQKALEYFQTARHDLVVADIHMLQMNRFQFARAIKRIEPSVPVVLYTSWGSMKKYFSDKVALADGFLDGPFAAPELRDSIIQAAEKTNAIDVMQALRHTFRHEQH